MDLHLILVSAEIQRNLRTFQGPASVEIPNGRVTIHFRGNKNSWK